MKNVSRMSRYWFALVVGLGEDNPVAVVVAIVIVEVKVKMNQVVEL